MTQKLTFTIRLFSILHVDLKVTVSSQRFELFLEVRRGIRQDNRDLNLLHLLLVVPRAFVPCRGLSALAFNELLSLESGFVSLLCLGSAPRYTGNPINCIV